MLNNSFMYKRHRNPRPNMRSQVKPPYNIEMSTVIIAGATGYAGLAFTRAFANAVTVPNSSITRVYALVQASSLINPAKAASVQTIRDIPNVEIRAATYDDPKSLTEALQGVDIVVSALGGSGDHGFTAQLSLIEAAKNAGVKRFVPSDYGVPDVKMMPSGIFDKKNQAHDALYAAGINYTIVDVGGFYKLWVTNLSTIGPLVEPVPIYGEGKQLANFVDITDIASYIVRAVVDPRLENKRLWIDNKPLTQLDIVETWEKITGRQLQKKFVSREEADENAKGALKVFWQLIILVWYDGAAVDPVGYVMASELYPEIAATTKSIEQCLREVAK